MAIARHSTAELRGLLKARYASDIRRGPERWAFIEEVRNAAGFEANRSCDAIAMGLWPSRGLHLHGHEIKASRSDWLKELQDPDKSEAFAKHCHYWWICAGRGLVKLEELPATWGLLEPGGVGLKVRRPATAMEPQPLTYGFLACLLRRSLQQDEVQKAVREAHAKGVASAKDRFDKEVEKRVEWQLKGEVRAGREAIEAIAKFKKESGLDICRWTSGDIGKAVRAVQEIQRRCSADDMKRLAAAACTLAGELQKMGSEERG